ncbi:MAG: hypothetical protein A2Z16_09805 [Chloroflexi bacterium RBG_16_54_18]|nr:MAG: hypothetical protein A2Z16_09805 [Chloroflexi bacterium RBG_16_54_18]
MKTSRYFILVPLIFGMFIIPGTFSRSASANPSGCLIPDAPVLLSPPGYSGSSDNTPAFDWQDALNASSYQIQVDDDFDFLSPEIDEHLAVSTFTPSNPLADSNYFWKARGINDTPGCNEPGPWSEIYHLLITTAPTYNISSNWMSTPPLINGQILGSEWTDAATFNITSPGPLLNMLPTGETLSWLPSDRLEFEAETQSVVPFSPTTPEYLPVTLYIKNSGSVLYMAIDNPNDSINSPFDQMGIYFDDNPLPSDGQWSLTTCGNADGEGNFYILASVTQFREWVSGAVICDPVVSPAPGVNGKLGYGSGHLQIEAAFNLQTSALRGAPGDVINIYFWIFDADNQAFDGKWPLTGYYRDPSTFGSLTLAESTQVSLKTFLPLLIR